jgi:two-component system, OmpR family, response regulator ChvI
MGIRIMIVDDEPDITTTVKSGLERARFIVDVFNHPDKALSSLEPSKYDAALVDVRMPGMGGFKLSRQINQIDNNVEIYFMTAFEIHAQEFKKIFPFQFSTAFY